MPLHLITACALLWGGLTTLALVAGLAQAIVSALSGHGILGPGQTVGGVIAIALLLIGFAAAGLTSAIYALREFWRMLP